MIPIHFTEQSQEGASQVRCRKSQVSPSFSNLVTWCLRLFTTPGNLVRSRLIRCACLVLLPWAAAARTCELGLTPYLIEVDETSSLVSSEGPGDIHDTETETSKHLADHQLHQPDITMHQLLFKLEFWQLFFLLGLLCGVGLMTIKYVTWYSCTSKLLTSYSNIGNDAQALWSHYDDSVSHSFILKRQLIQVAIISLGSFVGRLLTGVGSDFLVKKLHASRFWCLVTASGIFTIAQIVASRTENPNHLAYVSALTGLAYGALFGVYPAITADTFGIGGLSFNWGALTLSPVVTGNIFNLCYGAIYDKHSFMKDGERTCVDGLECYRGAYYISLSASLIGVLVSLWSIHHEHVTKRKLASQIGSHEA